jgi:hypothetical protein
MNGRSPNRQSKIVNRQSPLPITPHPANIRPMHTRHRWLIVMLLGVTAVFRLYGLNNLSPPGLEHDEVAHWLINRAILDKSYPLARDPFLCALPL